MCFSLNKSTSYPLVCLSLNSFCDETSRTWAPLSPEIRCDLHEKTLGSSPNLSCMVSVKETRPSTTREQIPQKCKYSKQGLFGPFRGWLPQCSTAEFSFIKYCPFPFTSQLMSSQPQCNSLVLYSVPLCMACATCSLCWNEWMSITLNPCLFFPPMRWEPFTVLYFFKDREAKV